MYFNENYVPAKILMFILVQIKIKIMKKLFIVMSVMAFGFSSCGDASEKASGDATEEASSGSKTTSSSIGDGDDSNNKSGLSAVCDCIDSRLNMMKDVMNGMSEEDAESKYAEDKKKCMAMGEGKTPEELDAINKEAEDCASMAEFKKIEKELMKKVMSEEMMGQGLDALEDGVSPK